VLAILLLSLPALADSATPGTLDTTFGRGGKVELKLAPLGTMGADVGVQADGRIVVLGMNFQSESGIYLARLLPDGGLDLTFGRRGKVRVVKHAGGVMRASAMALQPDGRIVVSAVIARGRELRRSVTLIARFLPDGHLDPSFGSGGRVTLAFDGLYVWQHSILVTRAGKIVVGGTSYPRGWFDLSGAAIALARLDGDGHLDRTFGKGGRLQIEPAIGGGEALIEQPDGKLIVGGDPGIRRLLDDGSLDPSFGDGGLVTTRRSPSDADSLSAVALDTEGRILSVGSNWYGNPNIVLMRHLPDGTLDPSFGSAGRVITDYVGLPDYAGAVLAAPDGSIVVTGSVGISVDEFDSPGRRLAVLRFLPDGTRDPSFGASGLTVSNLGASGDWGEAWGAALALHGDRLLVCGTRTDVGVQRTVVLGLQF
jgi:uncharacterized delta-60 repeat protein